MVNRTFWRYIVKRMLQSVCVLLIVIVGNFILLHAIPGDVVDVMVGQSGDRQLMDALRQRLGLDQPVLIQLYAYVGNILRGDLGYSLQDASPVLPIILHALPTTALLVLCSVVVALFIGTLNGVLAARFAHRPVDVLISVMALFFYATPIFLSAIGLIIIFCVKLQWLPLSGLGTPGLETSLLGHAADVARHLVLPVLSLSLYYIAIYTRLSRAAMLQVMDEDYIRTAYAKGLKTSHVILGHALRNALLPVVTMAGLQIAELFGGAVLAETIYGLPGIGQLAYNAVFQRNYAVILGILIVTSCVVVVVNLLIDIVYTRIDPRVEMS
ncbi:ABC transporter permease [Brenneria sp. g21c3]|uniref:ABC transporter permease n=1 Tax=Brenneria sp. g21c3 TaxID=3093893 RepID=UPI002EA0EA1D|nr:ABC transporter permease [Brenneria sp. g21c3]